MNGYQLLRMLLWGQVDGVEFKDNNNLLPNITFDRAKWGVYPDGSKIKLTKEFLEWSQWTFVKKHQTFLEAFNQAYNGNGNDGNKIYGLYQDIVNYQLVQKEFDDYIKAPSTLQELEQYTLSTFSNLTLKELNSDKAWIAYVYDANKELKLRSGVYTPTLPYPQKSYSFIDAIYNNGSSNYQQYIEQFNTGKKIYMEYEDGIKDSTTGQYVELDATFITEGKWYWGQTFSGSGYIPPVTEPETPEIIEGSGDMNLTQALTNIDWSTQELVYSLGGTYEFIIKDESEYNDKIFSQYLYENLPNVNVKQLLLDSKWTVRTRT